MSSKKEVKTLTVLVVAAMLVSLGGTLYVGQLLGVSLSSLTGAATAVTSISVEGVATDFDLDTTVIDFGSLARREFNITGPGSPNATGVKVTNNGSLTLNFSINFSAEMFSGQDFNTVAAFAYKCRNSEATCQSQALSNASVFPSPTQLVGGVLSTTAGDEYFLDVSVSVPDNEPGGQKTSTVTILSYAS